MPKPVRRLLIFPLCALAAPAWPVEIATGNMLGGGYGQRSFYVREGSGPWRKTYTGAQYRSEAAGRLMNLRTAQSLFHDEWLSEHSFDPDAHTDRFIAALDTYKEHGVLAISASLQGGNMQYSWNKLVARDRPFHLGPGKGSLVSAFRPNGSLKEAWMRRLLRLQRALVSRGMILGPLLYYQHQDEVLASREAVDRGIREVMDWLIANDCRNVIVEIANEHNSGSYDHGGYFRDGMARMIELTRSRFREKKAAFALPISASAAGADMPFLPAVRDVADLMIIHGNNKPPEFKRRRVRELFADPAMPGPVYMNEDNNGRETTPANLALELASCDAVFASGGSWGYMPWVQLQVFPFRHVMPSPAREVAESDPVERRDPAYFHAVLEHIRKLVEKPEAAARPCRLSRAQGKQA